ncbi:hypothetical protein NWP96_00275 [Mycoplasmopsis cynos]|nr:hypothetical protein [Mycoplasmopsis cynos]
MQWWLLCWKISKWSRKKKCNIIRWSSIPSVTDFISGWLKGIIKYNEENTSKKFKHKGKLSLNAHFEPSQQKTDILNAINADSTVIYPVAESCYWWSFRRIWKESRKI